MSPTPPERALMPVLLAPPVVTETLATVTLLPVETAEMPPLLAPDVATMPLSILTAPGPALATMPPLLAPSVLTESEVMVMIGERLRCPAGDRREDAGAVDALRAERAAVMVTKPPSLVASMPVLSAPSVLSEPLVTKTLPASPYLLPPLAVAMMPSESAPAVSRVPLFTVTSPPPYLLPPAVAMMPSELAPWVKTRLVVTDTGPEA